MAVILAVSLFLSYKTYGNWEFALTIRGQKLAAFVLVGIASGFLTISFQTITHSHFLTPSILGLDSLYILIQTVIYFFFGFQPTSSPLFFLTITIMLVLSSLLFLFLLGESYQNLFFLLMAGMIFGTFFRSLSTFLQVAMNPNEFDKLQGKLFAGFQNVQTHILYLVTPLILLLIGYLWWNNHKLDIFHLGKDKAFHLGISVKKFEIQILLAVSSLTAIVTALVGPVTFLGFILANITYSFVQTYRHRTLFVVSSLFGILFLVGGEFIVDHVFQLNTTLSVVIEFCGGLYFILKLLLERKRIE